MTLTASTLNSALKVLYAGQTLRSLVYNEQQRPFFSMLKKFKNFQGTIMPFPILYEDGAGRAATFSYAQAAIGSPLLKQWQLDVVENHGIARITTESILRSESDKGSFVRGLKLLMDSAINRLSNDIEASLFRDGSGSIGVGTTLTTYGLTLVTVGDVVNFYVGQEVVAAANITSSLRSATPGVVSAVNRDAGVVTFSAAIGGTFNPTDGDQLFTYGDYVTSSDKLKLKGLAAWLPASAPSATTFFNVDRSVDPTRLGGLRYAGSSANVEESIIGAASRLGRESSAVPNVALMSYTTFRQLVLELGAKVQRDQKAMGQGGFQTVEVYGPRGLIKCVACTFCPDSVIYLLTSDTWQLVSMGEPVTIQDLDGLKMMRMATADAFEVRLYSWVNLCCQLPGANVRISL